MGKRMKKQAAIIMAAAMFIGSVYGFSNGAEAHNLANNTSLAATSLTKSTQAQKTADEQDKNRPYLKTYFKVELPADMTTDNFNDALKKVAGKSAPKVTGELTTLESVKAAVIAADYDELAKTYSIVKSNNRFSNYGITMPVDQQYASYLACALDTGLLNKEDGATASYNNKLTVTFAEKLLMAVASANGDARNYLGNSSDPQIYSKLDNAWNSFILFDDKKLSNIGKEAVQQEVTTGYNLKNSSFDARFSPELTLVYGHSDIKHVHQLMGLLNSEDIDVKVQLEPKISIYKYLLEWGPVPKATPTYEVKKFGKDLYLVYAVEYDLALEFANEKDMLAFDSVIEQFAKKNKGNEEAKGLISGSWWQPLYSTTKTGMPKDAYKEIYDCVVQNGIYSIHPFALPKDYKNVVKKLNSFDKTLKASPVKRYCNTAFYDYLTGDDYQ